MVKLLGKKSWSFNFNPAAMGITIQTFPLKFKSLSENASKMKAFVWPAENVI